MGALLELAPPGTSAPAPHPSRELNTLPPHPRELSSPSNVCSPVEKEGMFLSFVAQSACWGTG